jgi:hypothetical protein
MKNGYRSPRSGTSLAGRDALQANAARHVAFSMRFTPAIARVSTKIWTIVSRAIVV